MYTTTKYRGGGGPPRPSASAATTAFVRSSLEKKLSRLRIPTQVRRRSATVRRLYPTLQLDPPGNIEDTFSVQVTVRGTDDFQHFQQSVAVPIAFLNSDGVDECAIDMRLR
jgi:hypothetical protein